MLIRKACTLTLPTGSMSVLGASVDWGWKIQTLTRFGMSEWLRQSNSTFLYYVQVREGGSGRGIGGLGGGRSRAASLKSLNRSTLAPSRPLPVRVRSPAGCATEA